MNDKQTKTEDALESQTLLDKNPCKNDKECQKRLIDAIGDCA
jgi:hypothetical protein